MSTLATGKTVEVMFENVLESYEHQMQMLNLTDHFQPDAGEMQNAANYVWRPVQQHAPIVDGWDVSNSYGEIIEEEYPSVLGIPVNDPFKLRADDLRDRRFWERRGTQSGLQQATELNKRIAAMIVNTGSLFYRTNVADGFGFVGEAQTIMNERQLVKDTRSFILNDRTNLKFAKELANRDTIKGRPEDAWATGQIGSGVAEFDIFTGSFLPSLVGGANPATTTTADVSDKPEAGSVSALGVVTNVDYRISSSIPVVATGSYNVGDKVTFTNTAVAVQSVGLADKTPSGQAMTFTIVEIIDATHVKVFPKPIAVNDAGLTKVEQAYANINTQILSGAAMNRLNIGASEKTNIFFCKNSIEVLGGDAPIQLLSEFGGMKVIQETMENGQIMYMAYDGNIDDMTFKCRLFTWYGITNKAPMANGVAISY